MTTTANTKRIDKFGINEIYPTIIGEENGLST
jgi:hypothetical protein